MVDDKAAKIAEARRKLLQKRLNAKRQQTTSVSQVTEFPKFADGQPIPASYGQESLWYVQQIAPDSPAYNMANVVRLSGKLNLDWLQQALDTVVARHEILRTNFAMIDGKLQQIVHPPSPVQITQISVNPDETKSVIYEQIELPFDLEHDRLFRVTLLHEADNAFVLIMSMHHIISDKWSLEVLIWREISACYTALSDGDTPELPPVETQFKDFVAWQSAKANTDSYQAQLNYWESELAQAPALLNLPLDKQRPPTQQFEGKVLYHTLPADITETLQKISNTQGVTLFMTLLSVYFLMLHRMSREDDILIGTSVDLRTHVALENTIGYFLNTVVLRQQFDETMTFTELLAKVRHTQLNAFTNQDVEFERLAQHLNPKRDLSYNPIFQTMFVMWDANNTEPELPSLELETVKLDPDIAKFDLTLYAQVNPDNTLLLALEYATSLFEADTMSRMMAIYQTLLQSVCANPEEDIAQLDWLPAEQYQILVDEWTKTRTQLPDTTIPDLIEEHDPKTLAILHEGNELTYGDLNQRANHLAHHLQQIGVEANTPVAIMVRRSPEMLIGILGILKAGAAYVPIDPAYPTERINFMLNDSGTSILLTQSDIEETLPEHLTRINLDTDLDTTNQRAVDVAIAPDDLAYIIYTSGSTGKPKGVRVTHRNLVHSTTARFSVYQHPIQRFLLLSSFAFDSSLVGIFWTLAAGGTLVLPPDGAERDIAQIASLLAQHQITHLLALPSLYAILLEFKQSYNFENLSTVIVAGEACPISLIEKHYKLLPDALLYNEYGPTEGTVWATVSQLQPNAKHVTIGRAIPNMQTYIVNQHLKLVPIGVAGELLIAGEGIAQGYHNRPDLTRERFIPNPFGSGKVYRTGDLVRYLPDGTIDFLGRIDRQVKISGYRIEIGEIETALQALKGVSEAAVIVHKLNDSNNLVGFVTSTGKIDTQNIKDQMRRQLPNYMIPQQIIALDDMPRTPNGKTDYRRLVDHIPEVSISKKSINYDDLDDIEQKLISIWEDLLGVQVPDTQADFFALGGYSLLVIRMFAIVKQTFDKDLPISTIFTAPTIDKLAEIIRLDEEVNQAIITLQAGNDETPIYCIQVNRFGVLHYQQFVDGLDNKYPVYGVVLPQSQDENSQAMPIEEVAESFTNTIIYHQPTQPIVLLGLSLAGTVAYEVARRLKANGIQATVIMVDTQGPNYPTSQPLPDALREKTKLILNEYRETPISGWLLLSRDMLRISMIRLEFRGRKLLNRYLKRLGLPLLQDNEQDALRVGGESITSFIKAYYNTLPTSDNVNILLYRGRLQPINSIHEWALGWDQLVIPSNITVQTVTGKHTDLLKSPYLKSILNHFEQWIATDFVTESEKSRPQ